VADPRPILTIKTSSKRKGRRLIWIAIVLVFLAVLAAGGWIAYRTWPRPLPVIAPPKIPRLFLAGGKIGIALPTDVLVAEIGEYNHPLQAYLYFDFLRTRPEVDPRRILLCPGPPQPGMATENDDRRIFLRLDNNILAAIPYLESLTADRLTPNFSLRTWSYADLALCQQQSLQFEAAFRSAPVFRLHQIPDRLLIDPLADFIVFKAATDRRLLTRADPPPLVPSFEQAEEFAEDLIVVARFYSLPLDYFLGIGAMENNYMSVRGDLDHAVWKRSPQRGDIVLERRRHRVLVRNYSLGAWQITRETLRYAQLLYLRDRNTRDYSALPEELRPTLLRDPDQVRPETTTTYAGLIFRNLLDRFHGDVLKAVGAYNGGTINPNLAYADSVRGIAEYVRRTVADAVVLESPPRASPGRPQWSPQRR
jgi:hypothetical protein